MFVNSHNPCAQRGSRQYMSAIFYHGNKQRQQAEAALQRVAKARGTEAQTLVTEAGTFYLAEDYHQKYRLRQNRSLVAEYLRIYPELADFVNSTAVTRVNGYVAGYGRRADLQRELPRLGLSEQAAQSLLAKAPR